MRALDEYSNSIFWKTTSQRHKFYSTFIFRPLPSGTTLLLYFPSSSVTLSRLTLFDEFSYISSKKSNIQKIIQTLIQFDVEPPPLIFPTHTILSFSPLYEEREREREKSSNSRKLGRNGPVISITIPRAPTKFCRRSYPNARYRSATQKKLCLSVGFYSRWEDIYIYIFFFISPRKTIHAPLFYPPPVSLQRLSKINIAPRIVIYTGKKIRYSVWSPLPALSWRGG